jgi:hypothetical protein
MIRLRIQCGWWIIFQGKNRVMNPVIIIVIGCIVCSLLAGLLYVAYLIINKPVAPKAALISDAALQALMAKYDAAAATPVAYSNILDYSIGHGNGHIMPPLISPGSLTINQCNTMCNGTVGCQGFQYKTATSECELLSNVANTLFHADQGWNIFVSGNPPTSALGSSTPGQGFSADASKKMGPIVGATTMDACAPYCLSNIATCVGFTVSPSGCVLYGDVSVPLQDATASSYKVNTVVHGTGLPASSPS